MISLSVSNMKPAGRMKKLHQNLQVDRGSLTVIKIPLLIHEQGKPFDGVRSLFLSVMMYNFQSVSSVRVNWIPKCFVLDAAFYLFGCFHK